MSVEQLLGKLLSEGFAVSVGLLGTGYFAEIRENDYYGDCYCDNCGHQQISLDDARLGLTIKEALENAEAIARGQEPKTKYSPEDFGIKNKASLFDELYDDDDNYLIRRCEKCRNFFFECQCKEQL